MNGSARPQAETERDIAWISNLLNLAPLDDPRRAFLNAKSSIDVSACPGSGKTTLVVAKLGLLAKSWHARSQGICVLSHTNVARTEIQDRLGGTTVGGELLRYPHYIDTIHGFVNRFLAAPWLQSNGYHAVAIDNDVVARVRRKFLGERDYQKLETFLSHKQMSVSGLRLTTTDFDHPLDGDFPAGPHTAMYQLATSAINDSATRGYFRHDEMFVFAQALLNQQPEVAEALRTRFPFVLIDEMQDTTAAQMDLISQVFPTDNPGICIQRVGDPNQAIFEGGQLHAANTFPTEGKTITLANSFRFDSSIAQLADGLANDAIQPNGLIGLRDNSDDEKLPIHTVFAFDPERVNYVLDAYAAHVLATFSDDTLRRSKVAVVGLVHKPVDESVVAGHKHFPKTVSHYWSNYEHTAAHRTSYFTSLVQYLGESRCVIQSGGTPAAAVDAFATGILKLANTLCPEHDVRIMSRPHKQLLRLLDGAGGDRQWYLDFVVQYVLTGAPIIEPTWNSLAPALASVAAAASGGREASAATRDFMIWSATVNGSENAIASDSGALPPNTCRIENDGRHVDLLVSSIHAVKGETHLSTLVLDTFSSSHYFRMLMPWLSGVKSHGAASLTVTARGRLFSAFVAMTRATHLLCLAMPRSSLGSGKQAESAERALREAGWAVVRV